MLVWRRGNAGAADERLAAAARELRDTGARFNLAQVLLEHAEVLSASGREEDAEPLLAEARTIFAALGAGPWLERCDSLTVRVSA